MNGYEIDFLAVGEESKSGDAIALRCGNLYGPRSEQFVMVIDGGTRDSGEELVRHISNLYNTGEVDLVVSTHPDGDHAAGLSAGLEQLAVRELWMHLPWEHAEDIGHMFQSGRITDRSLRESLREALQYAHELEQIAIRRRIPIVEPFSGIKMGYQGIHVLGPSIDFYQSLLPRFRETPEPKRKVVGFVESVLKHVGEAVAWVAERWDIETLTEPGDEDHWRSAENNSSVILLLNLPEAGAALFTGDAAVPALWFAAEQARSQGIDLTTFARFIQIPHHGSKHNVGPMILDRILGPKLGDRKLTKTAFVSAAKDGAPSHPSKKVTNAFRRRGAEVLATQGESKRHYFNAPERGGWTRAEPLPFYERVEE